MRRLKTFFVACLLVLAGFIANSSLEKYKLIETQRVSDVQSIVSATGELWTQAYEYEQFVEDLEALKARRRFRELAGASESAALDAAITTKEQERVALSEEFLRALARKRFVVGQEMTIHVARYVGFVNMEVQIQDSLRGRDSGEMKRVSLEALAEVRARLVRMRLSIADARTFATSLVR